MIPTSTLPLPLSVALLCIFATGCFTSGQIVLVTEIDKGRTHEFVYYTDGSQYLLEGTLSIGGQDHDAALYYNDEKALLVRQDGQCVQFPLNKVLFGFVPPTATELDGSVSESYHVSVLTRDSNEMPQHYEITLSRGSLVGHSLVQFSETKSTSEPPKGYAYFDNLHCITEEDYMINVG